MSYASLIRKGGQTVDVTRQVATGARDAHSTPIVAPQPVPGATGLPCLAVQRPGREVLTPAGTRAIGDWDVYLLPDAPAIEMDDALTLSPGGARISAVTIHPAPLGSTRPVRIVGTSGRKP